MSLTVPVLNDFWHNCPVCKHLLGYHTTSLSMTDATAPVGPVAATIHLCSGGGGLRCFCSYYFDNILEEGEEYTPFHKLRS